MFATLEKAENHPQFELDDSRRAAFTQRAKNDYASVARTNRFFARLTVAMIVLTKMTLIGVCVYTIAN